MFVEAVYDRYRFNRGFFLEETHDKYLKVINCAFSQARGAKNCTINFSHLLNLGVFVRFPAVPQHVDDADKQAMVHLSNDDGVAADGFPEVRTHSRIVCELLHTSEPLPHGHARALLGCALQLKLIHHTLYAGQPESECAGRTKVILQGLIGV